MFLWRMVLQDRPKKRVKMLRQGPCKRSNGGCRAASACASTLSLGPTKAVGTGPAATCSADHPTPSTEMPRTSQDTATATFSIFRSPLGTPPVRLGTFWKKFRRKPRKRSQSFSWNSPREYGWDPPNPMILGI